MVFTTLQDLKENTGPFYEFGHSQTKQYGEQFKYEENWGNSKEHIYNTSLWIAKVFDDEEKNGAIQVRKVPGISNDLIVSQPIWTPGGKSIVFVGLKKYFRRLGQIYCTNRASALYQIDISYLDLLFNDEHIKQPNFPVILTDNCEDDFGASFPSFSPDGSALIYFTFASSCTHSSCARLRKISWSQETDKKQNNRKLKI